MNLLLILGLLLPLAAQAGPDPLCADVQRLAKGAEETPAFDSLLRDKFAPRLLAYCAANGRGYDCHESLLPPDVSHAMLGVRIARCLPGASLTVEDPAGPGTTRVRSGTLDIILEESGAERAHVGRILHIQIRATR
jgi:hypothetical protein